MNSAASVMAVPVMPASLFIKAEVVLESNGGEGDIFRLDLDMFLGFSAWCRPWNIGGLPSCGR